MHNKETLGFFINFTLLHSPSDKPVSNPEGVNCTLLPPGTVIHLHALTFACLQRQAFLCFPMQFHAFNLKQMIAGKKKSALSPWRGIRSIQKKRKGLWANSSSIATINLSPKEIHNNQAGKGQDLWPRNISTDQHTPSLPGSLLARMALSNSYNDILSLPTVLQVHQLYLMRSLSNLTDVYRT